MVGAILLVALGAAMIVALAGLFQRRLIYLPMGRPGEPADAGLPMGREVSFETGDGLTLGAWFIPSMKPGRRPAVLFFPGNAGNRSYRSPLAAALAASGVSVLLMDYRGYAGNPGSPSEEGLASDARAALGFLRGLPEVDPERIVYFGESLGSGPAVTLAVEHPPAALVLRSPFSSLTSVAKRHYWFLPVNWLLKDRFENLGRIDRITCPLLVLAGDRDHIVPLDESRRLFEAAREPKHLAIIPGAGHNSMALLAGPQLLSETLSFLHETGVTSDPDSPTGT
jgi:fermentation-respiration switch protein FrsA (DUF1100 family)